MSKELGKLLISTIDGPQWDTSASLPSYMTGEAQSFTATTKLENLIVDDFWEKFWNATKKLDGFDFLAKPLYVVYRFLEEHYPHSPQLTELRAAMFDLCSYCATQADTRRVQYTKIHDLIDHILTIINDSPIESSAATTKLYTRVGWYSSLVRCGLVALPDALIGVIDDYRRTPPQNL